MFQGAELLEAPGSSPGTEKLGAASARPLPHKGMAGSISNRINPHEFRQARITPFLRFLSLLVLVLDRLVRVRRAMLKAK